MMWKRFVSTFVVVVLALTGLAGGAFIGFEILFGGDLPDEYGTSDPEVYTGNFNESLPEDIVAYIPVNGINHTDISIGSLGRSYLSFNDEELHDDCRANNVRATLRNNRSTNVIATLTFDLDRIGAPKIRGVGEIHIDGNGNRTSRFVGPELLGREFCIEREGKTEPHLVQADLEVQDVTPTDMNYGEWDGNNRINYKGEIRYQVSDRADLTYNIPLTKLEVGDEVYIDHDD